MKNEAHNDYHVAVIGAGPAGLYAAKSLAVNGVRVALMNRDIKPGGLAEYGIYPTKYKMKRGLRKQFRQILRNPCITYFGNLTVGKAADLELKDLREMGFDAILVTAGAQGTKWLGLPGEELTRGVYHAKDIVYHYNKLPPFSNKTFHIGRRVALIGVGNVMLDIARWLVRVKKVDEVVAIARRGPAEVKFTKKEMESVIANLDRAALDAELERVTPAMEAVSQDPAAAKAFILSAQAKALEPKSQTRFRFQFLASPKRILGDERGYVNGLEVEKTILVPRNGDTKAQGTGENFVVPVDTVIFCIGDKVDDKFGLPIEWNEFVKNPDPHFPVDGVSYESYDPQSGKMIEGIFLAGWSRKASSGLVGVARKDGERGAKAVIQYLNAKSPKHRGDDPQRILQQRIKSLDKPVVSNADAERLFVIEEEEAAQRGIEDFKFNSNTEMLAAIGLLQQHTSTV